MSFFSEVSAGIVDSLGNDYKDNWDHIRYDKKPASSNKRNLKILVSKFLSKVGFIRSNDFTQVMAKADKQFDHFNFLFGLLNDAHSKDLLVKVFLYRIMGYRRVKLPLNTPKYWEDLAFIERIADLTDKVDSKFENFILYKFDLNKIGVPIKAYFNALGVLIDFVIKQYVYAQGDVRIAAGEGDVVIDGGGCWGDTALFFADAVGPSGKVYSFEFIPFNLVLLRKNLALNPILEKRIEVVEKPVWEDSNTSVFYRDNGPASSVGLEPFQGSSGETVTLSIDDLVMEKNLQKLDFVKLDIEGAELNALKGGINSLRRFKPKLAIALYHNPHDFEHIPRFVHELNLGYKFYLSHCTIYGEETILFASVNND